MGLQMASSWCPNGTPWAHVGLQWIAHGAQSGGHAAMGHGHPMGLHGLLVGSHGRPMGSPWTPKLLAQFRGPMFEQHYFFISRSVFLEFAMGAVGPMEVLARYANRTPLRHALGVRILVATLTPSNIQVHIYKDECLTGHVLSNRLQQYVSYRLLLFRMLDRFSYFSASVCSKSQHYDLFELILYVPYASLFGMHCGGSTARTMCCVSLMAVRRGITRYSTSCPSLISME